MNPSNLRFLNYLFVFRKSTSMPARCLSSRMIFSSSLVSVDPRKRCLNFIQKREMKLWNEKMLRKMYWRKKSFDAIPEKLRHRSEWQDWDYSSELFAFSHRINEPQLDEKNLTQAFTHRSYVSREQAKQEKLGVQDVQIYLEDNQQMIQDGMKLMEEFLPKYLRYHLRQAPEECIKSLVDYLMSTKVLSDIAKWIGCIDLIICAEFPPNEQTLADTIPALIGALQKTEPKRAKNFLIDFILSYLNGQDLLEIWPLEQMDLNLNAYLEKKGLPPGEPRLMYKSAIGTIESCYVVGIYSDKKLLGQSGGESPKIAKRMAEMDSFRQMFGLTASSVRFEFGPKAYDLDLEPFSRENFSLFNSQSTKEQICSTS